MVGKSDTTRLTRSWLRGAPSRPLQACNGASTSFQPAATDPLHSAVAHVRIGISNVIPMRETGFWRSPSMLSTWWRRRRPTLAQPGEKQRRLVFVLGGGGSRGACSVGVLKALLEAGIQPVRLDAGFEQRLEYAHAAGTPAASATQHEDQAARSFPGLRTRRAAPSPPGQHGRGSPEPSLGHRYYV